MDQSRGDRDLSFEAIAERLEAIAERLEAGDSKLEEAVGLFEEGVRLARAGEARLDAAEHRIEQLLQGGEVAPLDVAPNASSATGDGDAAERPAPAAPEDDDVPF
jgi:exodeoxyribonuclease VII small subunit